MYKKRNLGISKYVDQSIHAWNQISEIHEIQFAFNLKMFQRVGRDYFDFYDNPLYGMYRKIELLKTQNL